MGIKVLSLYDGMACGMLALMEAGIAVDRYVAFEVDKYAVKTSSHNFPKIEHRGDVFKGDFTEFRGFNILMGGSPCTYWSIAQTNNRETTASGMGWELFSQYTRALKEAQPDYFIYENNKSMSKAIRDSIREAFGFEEIYINSALVSAQNRQRFYWVGKRNPDGTYSKVDVAQPEDMGILLRDVLDGGVPVCTTTEGKSFAVTATEWKGGNVRDTLKRHRRTQIAEPVRIGTYPGSKCPECDSKQYRIYSEDGKAVTLCGQGGGLGAKTGLYAICVPDKDFTVREATSKGVTTIHPGDCVDMTQPNSKTRRGRNMKDKCNCLTTSPQYYQYCGTLAYAVPVEWDENGTPTKAVSGSDGTEYPVYPVIEGQIVIKGEGYPIKLIDGYYIIRKLTVSECKRLQTVAEWYDFSCVSNTQALKMLGNGWTVSVIHHLLKAVMADWLTDILKM